jgi:ribosomal peptide maturation radical SAM protein 1
MSRRFLFIDMPFGGLRPAIGVSLLKSHLKRIDVPADIHYANLHMANFIGPTMYNYIAEGVPAQLLLGDWLFSSTLPGAVRPSERSLSSHTHPYLVQAEERFPGTCSRSTNERLMSGRKRADEFLDECMARIDLSLYKYVGFTSTFAQNAASLSLAARLKQAAPGITILFGGANCESEMGLALHRCYHFIDYVCTGEADRTLPELVLALEEGRRPVGMRGLVWREDGRSVYRELLPELVRDLDSLPYPDYDDFFEQYRQTGISLDSGTAPYAEEVQIETSRGCWWGQKHHCTFCGLNGLSMSFRSKSPQRAIDEILFLTRRYGTRRVGAVDNILDYRYFREFVPSLRALDLDLNLFYETKANLTRDQVRMLADAGIRTIQPGIESFSSNVLRIMKKGTSALQNIQLLKHCREEGVQPHWNLLCGFAGERPEDYEQTARLMDAIHHLEPPTLARLWCVRLDRFSPLYAAPTEYGVTNVRPDRAYSFVYGLPTDELSKIAYYFEYDYISQPDPETYVGPAQEALLRWHANRGSPGLVYDDCGDTLSIWDFRPDAEQMMVQLEGTRREVYLWCDEIRSEEALLSFAREHGLPADGLLALLEDLLRWRLMVSADGRYLSLASPFVRDSLDEDVLDKRRPSANAWASVSVAHTVTSQEPA